MKTEFQLVKIKRILNQTSIDLGEYVINPFMGCEFSCLYCYVRSNRVVSRKVKPWGEYVDIRINAPELLEKEIAKRKPKTVLLGSTTECFQPIEKKYAITKRILEILNKEKVDYYILTRSPLILDYLPLLSQGFCKYIYFTINNFRPGFKQRLEPKSPAFELRERAINTLLDEGVAVVPYFSPFIPWVSRIKDIFLKFEKARRIEFECLNFNLVNTKQIIEAISDTDPSLGPKFERMLTERSFYSRTYKVIENDIQRCARYAKKSYNIYVHKFGDYFKNTYLPPVRGQRQKG